MVLRLMVPTSPSVVLFDRWSVTYDGRGLQLFTYRPTHDATGAGGRTIRALPPHQMRELLGERRR